MKEDLQQLYNKVVQKIAILEEIEQKISFASDDAQIGNTLQITDHFFGAKEGDVNTKSNMNAFIEKVAKKIEPIFSRVWQNNQQADFSLVIKITSNGKSSRLEVIAKPKAFANEKSAIVKAFKEVYDNSDLAKIKLNKELDNTTLRGKMDNMDGITGTLDLPIFTYP